jgi:hypothetical protein
MTRQMSGAITGGTMHGPGASSSVSLESTPTGNEAKQTTRLISRGLYSLGPQA